MSYETFRGAMATTPHTDIDPALDRPARPHLTVVPDAPIAFEPEPLAEPAADQWQDRLARLDGQA